MTQTATAGSEPDTRNKSVSHLATERDPVAIGRKLTPRAAQIGAKSNRHLAIRK